MGDILARIAFIERPRRLFELELGMGAKEVVHGDDEAADAYAGRLRNAGFPSVVVPSKHDRGVGACPSCGTKMEPVVLPSRIPNLLINGDAETGPAGASKGR